MSDGRLLEALAPRLPGLVALRRELHVHPEPSGAEHATTAALERALRERGLAPRVLGVGTGLTCDVGAPPGGGSSRMVALRADIDALAMDDLKSVPYRSRVPGVSHACGHDAHACIVLGAGLVLADLLDDDPTIASGGTVRLIFEPAEESTPGGAIDVIREGWLDGVEQIFGLHCEPKLDVGQIGVRTGPITSAADMVEITLTGPGGHTARPELTVNLVSVAGQVAATLPALVADRAQDIGMLRLTFGAIHAGDAPNVIPTSAVLRGTLRTPDHAAWSDARAVVESAVRELVEPTGATWAIDHTRGVPPVVNSPLSTAVIAEAARSVVGDNGVVEAVQSWGGDSFAWYLERTSGSYARLGVHDPARQAQVDLHSGTFDLDERAIGLGVRVLVTAALRALAMR